MRMSLGFLLTVILLSFGEGTLGAPTGNIFREGFKKVKNLAFV